MDMLQQGVNQSWLSRMFEVSRSSLRRWQIQGPRMRSRRSPPNALSSTEKGQILDLLRSEEFVEDSPYQVMSKLLDRGRWLCSVSTMYRVLSAEDEVRERRALRRHPKYTKPVLKAVAPNELWSWDITRLAGPLKGQYYFLYAMIDVFSRYVVGWMVTEQENSDKAQHFIRESIRQQGIPENQKLTIHSDRGSPMVAISTVELLATLGLTQSFARPRVSDDNPFSEAHFKTLKYHRFFKPWYESLEEARENLEQFFAWYNDEHRHINLGLLTPRVVHTGQVERVLQTRSEALCKAYEEHPERFSRKGPKLMIPQQEVGINIRVRRNSRYVLS